MRMIFGEKEKKSGPSTRRLRRQSGNFLQMEEKSNVLKRFLNPN